MRAIAIVGWILLVVLGDPIPAEARRADGARDLAGFARQIGLRDVAGFAETVESLRAEKRLPPRYITKRAARTRGWRGGGLCEVWPGRAIGGDLFHNFGGQLPAASGRVYRSADLDATCRSRGPRRLVYSNDGRIYVTLDHYSSFVPVP